MATAETQTLKLGPRSNGMMLDPWEFDAADFERGWRYELINGVLIVNPAPLKQERDPNEELGHWLRQYQDDHAPGSSLDFTVSEETLYSGPHRRRPARAIWAGLGRLPKEREAPTIAVEFVSEDKRSRERDYVTKRHEYHSIGVREYWIIDRFDRTMTVHRFDGSQVESTVVTADQSYTTPLLPGFELPLSRLFELADRWSDQHEE